LGQGGNGFECCYQSLFSPLQLQNRITKQVRGRLSPDEQYKNPKIFDFRDLAVSLQRKEADK
jgi:hypothetical protein